MQASSLSSSIFKQDRAKGFYYKKGSMYYLNNGHLVHDLKNEMDQISDIRGPKGVFDQQIVADRFDMNDDACRRVNIFSMPAHMLPPRDFCKPCF